MEKRGNELMLINKILDAGTNVQFNFMPSQYQVRYLASTRYREELVRFKSLMNCKTLGKKEMKVSF